jgi:mannitol/fructose-specific phosphotransferase system IIA component (Ntr-type)
MKKKILTEEEKQEFDLKFQKRQDIIDRMVKLLKEKGYDKIERPS